MTLAKWNPVVLPEPGRFFDDFFKAEFPGLLNMNFSSQGSTLPSVNIKETDDDYQIEMAAPGMEKKDFKVTVDNGVLNISAEREMKDEKEEDGYTRREFSYSSFQRSFTLPETAEGDKIKAKYKDGILHLTLPKKPEAKPKLAKVIKVS
ncbi:MAG TPA: Hsp20/alpha crystallin family protein [Bacteroidetes bacterium]|nr:Hsp20/alpha crystallin family protein [Bacteroidota bacterium]